MPIKDHGASKKKISSKTNYIRLSISLLRVFLAWQAKHRGSFIHRANSLP